MDFEIAAVRSFNRFYTRVIGLLQEGLLHTPYTLTEARVIFELAQGDEVEVVALRRALDLDAGYLSRMLGAFEAGGLVARSRSATDGRRQVVTLTDAGRDAWRDLDRRSVDEVAALLATLGAADRARLLGAMAAIRSVLERTGPDKPLVVLRAPLPGDLGWIVRRHGELYAQAHGWDATFEAMVARIVADFGAGHDPAREALWIAEADGEPVGSVMCVAHDRADRLAIGSAATAQLRVLLVEPSARGLGLGSRLVDECLRFARRAGYTRMVLSTYSAMASARQIYAGRGFAVVSATPVHAYGHDLVDEVWSLDL